MKNEDVRAARLSTQRLDLRPFRPEDGASVHEAVMDTYDLLIPWRIWVSDQKDKLTPALYEEFGRKKFRLLKEGKDITLIIRERSSGILVGGVSINKISPDRTHGYLGFWLRRGYTGRGYAHEAARRMIDFAFHDLGHNHINAAHQVGNMPSRTALLRLGFHDVDASRDPDMKSDWRHYVKSAPT